MAKRAVGKRAANSEPQTADFAIITALEEERDAVLSKLGRMEKLDKTSSDVHTYYHGRVRSTRKDRSTYDVIVTSLLNMGPTDAAAHAIAIVNRWKPKYVLLVGIACGVPGETDHGDILIANQVADYTLGKQQDGRRKVRWTVTPCGPSLLDSAMNLSASWQRRIRILRPGPGEPLRRKGVVASGGDVIADDQVLAAYTDDWPKLVGIEMEAGGLAAALHQTAERPEFLMVKGVSDFGSDKHEAEVLPWRDYACHAAAAFARGIIESGPSAKIVGDIAAGDDEQEALKAAERRWTHLQQTPLRGIEVLLVLKTPVGREWLTRVLDDTFVSLSREDKSFKLSRALTLASEPNTKEHSARWEEAVCSYWERYEPDPAYWVRRIAPDPGELNVVSGFDAAIPWKFLDHPATVTLGHLGPLTEIGIGLPPAAFRPGVEEFKLTFVGDRFSLSIWLSDHGLSFLHEMANMHNQLSKSAGEPPRISLGTHFDGIQLLEMFRAQSMPDWRRESERDESIFGGMGGSGGKAISFYPAMPRSFNKSDEAREYSITLDATSYVDATGRIAELERARRDGIDAAQYGELAACYAHAGRFADAISCLEEGIVKGEPNVDLQGLLGEILGNLGRFAEAIIPLRRGLEIAPEHGGLHSALGTCLRFLGRHDEAIRHFETAVRFEPLNARYHGNLGWELAHEERYAEAIDAFVRAAELDPDDPEYLENLGVLYHATDRISDAEASFTKATLIAPSNAKAQENLGRHFATTGEPERAIPLIRRAVELEPSAKLHAMLGSTLGAIGNWLEAETAYREATLLAPDDHSHLRNLGICIMRQERLDEAVAVFEQFSVIEPADEQVAVLIRELRELIAADQDQQKA